MPEQRYGIEAGERAMAYGDRWPKLRPKDGDRARFHFLTTGNDPWLVATKFHKETNGTRWSDIVCLQALTHGEEPCIYCEIDTSNRRNMFACWVWTEFMLHPRDNPDEDGDAWEQRKLQLATGREITVFKEDVKKAQLLWLPAGRSKAWWSQFTNAWMVSGNLQKHLYDLHRTGEGRDDTNYILTANKEDPLDPAILELDEVKALPDIEEVFRQTLTFAPRITGDMGSDSLSSNGTLEDLPKVTAPVSSDDDLI